MVSSPRAKLLPLKIANQPVRTETYAEPSSFYRRKEFSLGGERSANRPQPTDGVLQGAVGSGEHSGPVATRGQAVTPENLSSRSETPPAATGQGQTAGGGEVSAVDASAKRTLERERERRVLTRD